MDFSIAAILAQDGVSTGAIYALLALATVLLFSVTRIIFLPQGEFVAFGALTMAAMQSGKFAGTANLLLVFGMVAFLMELYDAVKQFRVVGHTAGLSKTLLIAAGKYLIFPLVVFAVAKTVPTAHMPMLVQAALTLAIVVPMGPLIYRVAFQSLAEASVLVLLIVSVGVHFALVGIGLVIFGAEGSRTTPFSDASYQFGTVTVTGQSAAIVGVSILLIGILYVFFERTLVGKALRATAVNRLGARLMGIGTAQAGRLAFTLAAGMGALSGILIAPITTVYYDTGFLIGLKGFVGAIIGGLASYPVAAVGALLVGLLESYSSFWASAFKEVIVFTLVIPVLLWRSFSSGHQDEEE
ncbi:MAG: branched-chain amino acid ABC transporter permease [Burkholderiaceae bacterium]|jgi:branched-chain amino acid transport system permease protein|nr:branched-chain amino acid ABC transporter permease [Burkholderiaceae bacterium]MCC7226469.1 branched-chain amino acid ABC transporter permease [Burkholderiaceae bacterium]